MINGLLIKQYYWGYIKSLVTSVVVDDVARKLLQLGKMVFYGRLKIICYGGNIREINK